MSFETGPMTCSIDQGMDVLSFECLQCMQAQNVSGDTVAPLCYILNSVNKWNIREKEKNQEKIQVFISFKWQWFCVLLLDLLFLFLKLY